MNPSGPNTPDDPERVQSNSSAVTPAASSCEQHHGLPGEEYPLPRSVQRRIEIQSEACGQMTDYSDTKQHSDTNLAEPYETLAMYDQHQPAWFTRYVRCRAVNCSTSDNDMPEGFCHDCYRDMRSEVLAERRIVEWLRTPIEWTGDAKPYAEASGMDIEQVEWVMRRTHDVLADAIERGEHRG